MTLFVITKDFKSFREMLYQMYYTRADRPISSYVYVDSPDRIRGYSNPNGVLVGDWDQHPHISDILDSLLVQSTDPDKIRKIRRARTILAERRVELVNK